MKRKTSTLILLVTLLLTLALPLQAAAGDLTAETGFEIYFLNVGEGDSAVVLCEGHAMIIDGGSPEYSSYVYSFLKSHGIGTLDYVVATHPDSDHIGGLPGALNYADAGTVFCTVDEHDTNPFLSLRRVLERQGKSITVPDAGDTYMLGGAVASFLAPEQGKTYSGNTSLVLKITYGGISFLFTGDAETEDEYRLSESGFDISADVLIVGHHGSSSSTSQGLLDRVRPRYAVISVGKNSYGHPDEAVLSRLAVAGTIVYRTDLNGIIHCVSDGTFITFECEKNDGSVRTLPRTDMETKSDSAEERTPNASDSEAGNRKEVNNTFGQPDYIANLNSKKFHYPDCASVGKMKESNKRYFTGSRDELISEGYSPCGNCCP